MTLLEVKAGAVAEIRELHGGKAFAERLQGFGVYVGRKVRMVRAAPFHGPLLIEDVESGARIMIARGMAGKIEVEDGGGSVH